MVIAILAVLVLLAMPKMNNYQREARLTNIKNNIKVLEGAAERYYLDHQKWPRNEIATPYSKEELEEYVSTFLNLTGKTVELDDNGLYYPISYKMLDKYSQKPKDEFHYIIQNPVGNVFYIDDFKEEGKKTIKENYLNNEKKETPKNPDESEPPAVTLPEKILHLTVNNISNNEWRSSVGSSKGNLINFPSSGHISEKSLIFDGVNDYVDFGNNFNMGLSDFSFSGWIKTSGNTDEMTIISKGRRGDMAFRYYIGIEDDKILAFIQGKNSSNTGIIRTHSTTNVIDNKWYHVAVNYDRDGMLSIYVNGIKENEVNISALKNDDIISTTPFRIGSTQSEFSTEHSLVFKGEMSNISIHNQILTPEQINQIYNIEKKLFTE